MTACPIFAEHLLEMTVLALGAVHNWIPGIKIQIWEQTLLLAVEKVGLFELFPAEVEEGQLFFSQI